MKNSYKEEIKKLIKETKEEVKLTKKEIKDCLKNKDYDQLVKLYDGLSFYYYFIDKLITALEEGNTFK